jgi:PEP-CTERM motif
MVRSYLKYFPVTMFAVLTLAASPMHATTIFSENFNTSTVALGVTTAGQFTAINGTNVDVVGAADGFQALCSGPESVACVDLGGSGGDSAGAIQLTTPLSLAAGVYDLSFDLLGSQRGTTTTTVVTFGNNFSQTFVLGSSDVEIFNEAISITGGPTQLTFTDIDPTDDNMGALLDNVTILTPSSVTPEPSSLMLLGTGFLGVVGMVRRKLTA